MSDSAANPCELNDCHICCIDTQMTLTLADVTRLEDAGFGDFYRQDGAFDLVLCNRDGRCVFLGDGKCQVYDVRPEGCRLYPFILDLRWDRVVCDDLCPHGEEFPVDGERSARLRRSVEEENAEAGERRRRSGG